MENLTFEEVIRKAFDKGVEPKIIAHGDSSFVITVSIPGVDDYMFSVTGNTLKFGS